MYQDFFGLKEAPFSLTPDSSFLYLSKHHQEALDHLQYGISQRKGFILVTGEVGCGKTTLCRTLIKTLGMDTEIALVLNSYLSELELLRAINKDFNIDSSGTTREELISTFNEFLIRECSRGKNVVILIDESQNLSLPVLEQIRMLSNLETEKQKLLQIILVGQPELREILARPELRQLNQRLVVKYHIQPLTVEETGKYIMHRLAAAGAREGAALFTAGAIKRIHRHTKGIPRMINVVCDYALLNAFTHSTHKITGKTISEVIDELSDKEALAAAAPKTTAAGMVKKLFLAACIVLAVTLGLSPFMDKGEVARILARLQGKPAPARDAGPAAESASGHAASQSDGDSFENAGAAGALINVIKLWDIEISFQHTPPLDAEGVGNYFRSVSAKLGFTCFETWAGIEYLQQLNLPFIMELKGSDHKPRYITVTGISRDRIEFMREEGVKEMADTKSLLDLYRGRSFVFCKGMQFRFVPVYKGLRSPFVSELQKDLARLRYYTGPTGDLFDGKTESALKRFQHDHGFPEDGVLSTEALFLLKKLTMPQERTPTTNIDI